MQEIGKSDVCQRCGGCGRYSFNLMDADMCYGCNGRGTVGAKLNKAETAKLVKVGPEAFKSWLKRTADRKEAKSQADEIERAARFASQAAEREAKAQEEAEAKEVARIAKEEAESAMFESTSYLGAVGDKVEFTATVSKVRSGTKASYTGYGTSTWFLTVLTCEDGSSVLWWNAFGGTANAEGYTDAPQEGEAIRIKATVKALGFDKVTNAKQTEILRAKLLEIVK